MRHFTTLDLTETIQDEKLLGKTISFVRNRIQPASAQQIRVKGRKEGSVIIRPFAAYSVSMVLAMIEKLFQEDQVRYVKHHAQWKQIQEVFELLKQKQAVKRGVKVWDMNLEKRKVLA